MKNWSQSPGRRAADRGLDRLARQALANHVELIEAAVVKANDAFLGVVRDLYFEAQRVSQLPLERDNIRIDRTGGP